MTGYALAQCDSRSSAAMVFVMGYVGQKVTGKGLNLLSHLSLDI